MTVYFILEINHKSCYVEMYFKQSVVCIKSYLKDRVTVDPVYIKVSFIGVSQAHSVLTLLLDGLQQRRSEQ